MATSQAKITLESLRGSLEQESRFHAASPLRRRQTVFNLLDAVASRPDLYELDPGDREAIETWAKAFMKPQSNQGSMAR